MNYALLGKHIGYLSKNSEISDLDVGFGFLCMLLVILSCNFVLYFFSKDSEQSSDSVKKIKTAMYIGGILLCGFMLLYVDNLQTKNKELKRIQEIEKMEKFLRTPEGLDKTAREKSLVSDDIITSETGKMFFHGDVCGDNCLKLKETYEREENERKENIKKDETARKKSLSNIILSETGNLFYQGIKCEENCLGYTDGYNYAWNKGITNEDACDSDSESFTQGCLKGINDVIDDLRDYFKQEFPEDYNGEDDIIDYDDSPLYPFAN